MAPTADSQMDSAWSWVILACSFACLYCFSLLATSVGMLQVEMIEDLGFGSGMISIMTAFAVGLSTLLGPVSGMIASVLSMRFTIIIGTVLMSLGMLCTAFSHSLPALLFFYGILTGLGHGIAYTPCIVIVHHYFEKRRILANGIMTSSSSFALLSLTYLHRYVIDEYGWRFCFAINAALLLHIIVFASFFKPTEMEKMSMVNLSSCLSRNGDASKNGSECADDDLNKDEINYEENGETDGEKNGKGSVKKPEEMLFLSKESFHSSVYLKKMDMIIKSTDNISVGSKTSKPYIPIYINGTPKLRSPVNDLIAAESLSLRHSLHSDDGDAARSPRARSISQVSSISALSLDDHPATPNATTHVALQSPASLKPHKFGQLRKNSWSRSHLGSSLVFASCDLGSSIMLPVAIEEIRPVNEDMEEETLKTKMKRIAGCKPLWVLCINALFLMFGCGTHAVHLPSFVESKGIGSHLMANIYTVLGVVIAIGRVAGGALYNRVKPPLLPLLFILQFLNGVILILAPFFATEISTIFVMEAGIGLVYGQSYMIQAPVVTQIVGVEDLSVAFGFIQLFNGIGFICSPIISGFLYDITGNFDIPFCFAGSVVLAGSFFLLAMMISNYRDKKQNGCETTQADEEEAGKSMALIKGEENA